MRTQCTMEICKRAHTTTKQIPAPLAGGMLCSAERENARNERAIKGISIQRKEEDLSCLHPFSGLELMRFLCKDRALRTFGRSVGLCGRERNEKLASVGEERRKEGTREGQ